MHYKVRYLWNIIHKNNLNLFLVFLIILICRNVITNYRLCDFRSRHDYSDIMSFYRDELTPGTTIITHMYNEYAIGAFERLDYIRKDFFHVQHSNNLNSQCIAKLADLSLPAFLDLKNRSKNRTMFYITDKNIDENYTLVPLPTDYHLRFIMGDIANLLLYKGFEERQLYYALPRESAAGVNQTGEKITAANFNKYKGILLNNWEVLPDKSFIRPKYIGIVSNILICKPENVNIKQVVVKASVTLNPVNEPNCKIKKVDLAFYLNNTVIKHERVNSSEETEIIINIPVEMLTGQYNFLAIVPFYNSVNCFYPSSLYPCAWGTMPKGEYPYLIKSLSITEKERI